MNNTNTIYDYQMPSQGTMPRTQKEERRAKWNRRLMARAMAAYVTLPDWFATYAVATYAVALLGVNLINSNYAMEWYFWLFGIVWVAGFFFLSVKYSREWSVIRIRNAKPFERKLFLTGFWIRAVYVILIYFFYVQMNNKPHEFQAADSEGYIALVEDWSLWITGDSFWMNITEYAKSFFSDMGYCLFLLLPVHWIGGDIAIIVTRLIQALIGAYTSVIIYRLASRSMGEATGRMAGIFCMLHPVLICYAGMTLKEVLMTFLLVLFIDMVDRMLRGKKYTFASIAPTMLAGLSLFMFRTVLGMIAFMAVFFALVMSDTRIVSWGKKVVLGGLLAGILLMSLSDNILREIEQITQTDAREQQERSLEFRYGEKKGENGVGNAFAKYAGAAVFAPMIFTIPFPTMVVIPHQEDMRLIQGGNWMRNIMSGFVILAMVMLLLSGDWRKYTLPLAMMLGYLLMLAFTEFAHSLRFHIPIMPFEMMFAAYAITNMRKKQRNWYLYWCMFTILTCFAWNWFKLKGRGL